MIIKVSDYNEGEVEMKKPYIIMLSVIILGAISILTYFIVSNRTNLEFEKVELDQLNTTIQTWINKSCQDKTGIYLYEINKENGYEAILYFNKYKDVYLYIAQEIDVIYKEDKLTVSISDLPATHDSDVKNDFFLYITMKKNPKSIEMLLNDEQIKPQNSTSGKIEEVIVE